MLRPTVGGERVVAADGSTLRELILNVDQRHPGFASHLLENGGTQRRFVNIYLNEEDIRFMKGMDTPLKDGDQISIVPAIAGGAEESVPRARATASTVIGDGCVKYDSRAGWCYENQTMSREAIPAALNNHQAFGSSKLGMAGGYNGGGTR